MSEDFSLKDKLSLYEDGKHRRYTLLFSVNGGAFAIAKLLVGAEGKPIAGGLTLPELSWGMILFTIIMVADIYAFGDKMRKDFSLKVFASIGKLVLISIGLLICGGWFLVAHAPFGR
jgi:hypothetical protein